MHKSDMDINGNDGTPESSESIVSNYIREQLYKVRMIKFNWCYLNFFNLYRFMQRMWKKCKCKSNRILDKSDIDKQDIDMLRSGIPIMQKQIDIQKLIKYMRMVKIMAKTLFTKQQRKLFPYLNDSLLDIKIKKERIKKLRNNLHIQTLHKGFGLPTSTLKKAYTEKHSTFILNVKKAEVHQLDLDSVVKNINKGNINKYLLTNLIDTTEDVPP